jgi:hypothetical protein
MDELQYVSRSWGVNKILKDYFDSTRQETKKVCLDCVKDEVVRTIFSNRRIAHCSFCERAQYPAVEVKHLVSLVQRDAPSRYEIDPELYRGYCGLTLERVVAQMLLTEDSTLSAEIASLLLVDDEGVDPDNPPFFWSENTYRESVLPFESYEDERNYVLDQWRRLNSALMHRHRFFNREAEEFFSQMFEEALMTKENTLFGERSPVVSELAAGSPIYRARIVDKVKTQDEICGNPSAQMGAPPSGAAKHNRMNPAGISLFYGAASQDTCIAEVRPSIGDKVALARFETTKSLKIFDFHGLSRPFRFHRISPFEGAAEQRRIRQSFLLYLHEEIAMPVRDDGMSYIVTQAMTELFAKKYGSEFAGFCFKSVQKHGGRNIVLFGQSDDYCRREPEFPVELVGDVTYLEVTSVTYEVK